MFKNTSVLAFITNKGVDAMAQVSKQIGEMVDMLSMEEQLLAFELIKRMVLAWDSDFTKLTLAERETLEKADIELENGEVLPHEDVWK